MAWGSQRGLSHRGLLFEGGVPFLFAAEGIVKNQDEGKAVKVSAAKTVAIGSENDVFHGIILAIDAANLIATVQLRGFVTVKYKGQAPVPGRRLLVVNDAGGVKSGSTAAAGTLTLTTNPTVTTDSFAVGGQTFTFKAARAAKGDVKLGTTVDETIDNIVAAVNADIPSIIIATGDKTADTVLFTATVQGPGGNAIVFTESSTATTADGSGVLGGTTAGSDDAGNEYLVTDVDKVAETVTFLLK